MCLCVGWKDYYYYCHAMQIDSDIQRNCCNQNHLRFTFALSQTIIYIFSCLRSKQCRRIHTMYAFDDNAFYRLCNKRIRFKLNYFIRNAFRVNDRRQSFGMRKWRGWGSIWQNCIIVKLFEQWIAMECLPMPHWIQIVRKL